MNIYETIYKRLEKLGIIADGKSKNYRRSKSDPYMDLVVEKTGDDLPNDNKGFVISLAHYFEQNGDLCCDPEMTIAIYPETRTAEALTFQQDRPPIYQQVYPEPNMYSPRLKKDLNSFLKQWLKNLIDQDHGKEWENRS